MVRNIPILVLGLLILLPNYAYSQTIVWEKIYNEPNFLESHSFRKVLYSSNNKFFYLVGHGVHLGNKIDEHTSFVLIAKIDTLGNLIFAKTYPKFINDKSGFIYFSDAQLDSKKSEETITFWGFLATKWVTGWTGLFYPYIVQFDVNGNKIFENFIQQKDKQFTLCIQVFFYDGTTHYLLLLIPMEKPLLKTQLWKLIS